MTNRIVTIGNKLDGYRQQNVRKRQKLISIIDYNVCMTFY